MLVLSLHLATLRSLFSFISSQELSLEYRGQLSSLTGCTSALDPALLFSCSVSGGCHRKRKEYNGEWFWGRWLTTIFHLIFLDSFFVLYRHSTRPSLAILARTGFDVNWCPVSYASLTDFQARFERMVVGLSVSPLEFTVQEPGFSQQIMDSYSVLINSGLSGETFYDEYVENMRTWGRCEADLRALNYHQSHLTHGHRHYAGANNLFLNVVPDMIRSRLFFGISRHILSFLD